MADPVDNTGGVELTPEEQASVEKGRQGFQETPDPAPADASQTPQRPDNIPEKFWDAEKGEVNTEALLNSYTHLETKLGKPKEEKAEDDAAPVGDDGKIKKSEEPTEPATSPLTDLIAAAQTEYGTNREVSEETIEKLAEAGIPKEVFAMYLRGVQAEEQAVISSVHEIVGGKENYEKVARWAANKLSEAELDAFNSALDNPALRENAVRGLYSRYQESQPNEGKMVAPNGSTGSDAGDVYTSREQLIEDQKSPEYQKSADFRQMVQDKLMRSQRNGFKLTSRPMFERQSFKS